MKTRSFFCVFLILVAMQVAYNPSAGAASCTSVKSQILKEEKVGKILWREFYTLAKETEGTIDTEIDQIQAYIELLNSDLVRYSIAQKNSNCFTSTSTVKIRKTYSQIKLWLKAQNTNLEFLNDHYFQIEGCNQEYCDTPNFYDTYLNYQSIYSLK